MIKKILNNKIFKFVYGTIRFIFFTCIVLYLIFIIIQRISNNSSIAGFRMFTVASDSMKPVYNIGDVLLVENKSLDSLKVKDDITYLGLKDDLNGKIITHRIIEINGDEITTKGVANVYSDPIINYSQVYGKVIYKVQSISFISRIIRNQYGFYFLVFVPLIVIIFLEVVEMITGRKKDEDE